MIMKKITLSLVFLFMVFLINGQVITKITQSPNNPLLLGVINSIWADAASTGWSTPDLTNAANAIEAELMFAEDGVDTTIDINGNPTWQDGCEPIINDLTGKIAVMYRSFCWHDIKADYAQQAGAIGVILINRDPGPFAMGGSTVGSNVTIPVVSIGSEEGDLLKSYIAMGGVFAFIGTKVGLNANDLGSSPADIVMSNHQAIPNFLAANGSEFSLDLGLYVFNPGSNSQTGITASVDVSYNGSSVYTNTSTPLNFAAPVGVTVDTVYADLGTYAPASWSSGTYQIKYTVDLANDEDSSDNVFNTSVNISSNIFAKSRVDSLNNPLKTTAYSLNESSTQYDDWEACIVFQDANASRGSAMGMTFSSQAVGFDIDFEVLEVRLYEWNDVFTDITTPPTFTALNQVAEATYYYDYGADGDLSGQNIYVPFNDGGFPAVPTPWPLVNNKRYLFCVYNASDSIRLGYDTGIDYTGTINNYLQPISPVKVLPNGQAAIWYRDGFGWDATPSISATLDYTTSIKNNSIANNTLTPFPNPALNMLSIPVRKGVVGDVVVEIFDLAGKLVLSDKQTIGDEPLRINVASISNGTYLFKLAFADGTKDGFKISVNR